MLWDKTKCKISLSIYWSYLHWGVMQWYNTKLWEVLLAPSLIIININHEMIKVVKTPCFEEEEKLVCVDRTWWGQCRSLNLRMMSVQVQALIFPILTSSTTTTRSWKMVKHLTWRDISWTTTNTAVVNSSRTKIYGGMEH